MKFYQNLTLPGTRIARPHRIFPCHATWQPPSSVREQPRSELCGSEVLLERHCPCCSCHVNSAERPADVKACHTCFQSQEHVPSASLLPPTSGRLPSASTPRMLEGAPSMQKAAAAAAAAAAPHCSWTL
eukprot:365331-Chlamydomonas_euryale.AAC.1